MAMYPAGKGPELEAYMETRDLLMEKAKDQQGNARQRAFESLSAPSVKAKMQERADEARKTRFEEEGTDYSYQLLDDGNYAVFRGGKRTGTARQGTGAHDSIKSLQETGKALTPKMPKAPKMPAPSMEPTIPSASLDQTKPAPEPAADAPYIKPSPEQLRNMTPEARLGLLSANVITADDVKFATSYGKDSFSPRETVIPATASAAPMVSSEQMAQRTPASEPAADAPYRKPTRSELRKMTPEALLGLIQAGVITGADL